ncbi:type II secretion system F family protein, partial [Angustibacter peucedani]
AWRLADRTGAPLADLLDGAAAAARDDRAVAGEVEVALAGPRATVRLLTALPLGGLALGQLMGAHPVLVLLGTTPGRACAVLGAGLLLVGRSWMRRLVSAVQETA